MTLDVLVSVGTDVHRFDRLLDWLDHWYSHRAARPQVLVQYGRSRASSLPGAVAFLDHAGLDAAMAEARVVVTHGGPASITEARRHGHVPIVVARDPAFGEHVDDHQLLFARRMASAGVIRLCNSAPSLAAALDETLTTGPAGRADPSWPDDHAQAVARVGRIVDDLVAARRRRPGGQNR